MSNHRSFSTMNTSGSQKTTTKCITETTYSETKRELYRSIMYSGNKSERKLSTMGSASVPYTDAFKREFSSAIEPLDQQIFSSFKTVKNDAVPYALPVNSSSRSTNFGSSIRPNASSANSTPRPTNFTFSNRPQLKVSSSPPTQNLAISRNLGTTRENSGTSSNLPKLKGEKIKIVVKKEKNTTPLNRNIPMYKTDGKYRGKVLIINNIMFDKKDDYRKGAEVDQYNLEKLFKKMGFQVKTHKNLQAQQMRDTLKKHSKSDTLKLIDISIIVMMSHGTGELSGSTLIMGTDNKSLPTEDIVEMFDNVNCPNLLNKPKIFIFQCCRGGNKQIICTDSAKPSPKKKLSDILIAYSTIPGYVSNRNPLFGTWYISSICKVFMEHAWNTHVEDLLKLVEEELTKLSDYVGQTSNYDNRGFKLCYLNPK